MNTLPNTPMNSPARANSVKYSQSSPARHRGWQSPSAREVNIPPMTPTISTTYMTMRAAVAPLERGLFFFAS